VWHEGPGLHKVNPGCDHVLVDCSLEDFYSIPSEVRYQRVMREKLLALTWHLQYGVLSNSQEDRIVVFCNTIENCRFVENNLRKMDPRDKRSGTRRWKVFVLHGLRHKGIYNNLVSEFNGERVKATDFFKKRILVCTDRLSRGIDFSKQRISWVVLFDWPRDASEYLRRAGRTARGGSKGGVLSLVSGKEELKMSKMITSAAIRGLPLQSQALASEGPSLTDNVGCLERFSPLTRDWRSPEAALPKQRQPEKNNQSNETIAPYQDMQQEHSGYESEDDNEYAMANQNWPPRSSEGLGGRQNSPLRERRRGSDSFSDAFSDDFGVSLDD